jgi:hypothetical protein
MVAIGCLATPVKAAMKPMLSAMPEFESRERRGSLRPRLVKTVVGFSSGCYDGDNG